MEYKIDRDGGEVTVWAEGAGVGVRFTEGEDTLLANKNELKAAQDRLARMRTERLEFQPTLFDEV